MGAIELILRLVAGIALMLGNAFFVAVEFALTRLGEYDEETLREAGAGRAYDMMGKLEFHLTGCQVGITFTSILLGVVAEPAFTHLLMPVFEFIGVGESQSTLISVTIAVVIINIIHTVWGEQSPTYLGVERPLQVARWLARPLGWWTTFVYPLIFVGDKLSKATLGIFNVEITRSWTDAEGSQDADIRERLAEVLGQARIAGEHQEEVVRAYEISKEPVDSIMVKREDVVALSTEKSASENLKVIETSMHTRYAVVGDGLDDPRGIIYLPLLLTKIDAFRDGDVALDDLSAEPLMVERDMSISDFIDFLQEKNQEMAFVCSQESEVVGIVTATDAFEAIIGDLEDPLDHAA